MPRFVILEHDHPSLHWDFMLEAGLVLRTWRLAQPPIPPVTQITATALRDHRLHYLDYEGPVSGNRGRVIHWDAGAFELLNEGSQDLLFRLHGNRIQGVVRLFQRQAQEWTFEIVGESDA